MHASSKRDAGDDRDLCSWCCRVGVDVETEGATVFLLLASQLLGRPQQQRFDNVAPRKDHTTENSLLARQLAKLKGTYQSEHSLNQIDQLSRPLSRT